MSAAWRYQVRKAESSLCRSLIRSGHGNLRIVSVSGMQVVLVYNTLSPLFDGVSSIGRRGKMRLPIC